MNEIDTTDPALRSWVPGADRSEFPIQNLPFGVFSRPGEQPRVGVAIGPQVLDLMAVAEAGLMGPEAPTELFASACLNPFLAAGPGVWASVRQRLSALLGHGEDALRAIAERVLVERRAVRTHLPIAPGDAVDFYASEHHAANVGGILRPDAEPLLPNWRHMPVAYNMRASTIVVDGTPVRRPHGQLPPGADGSPGFGPTRQLDFELEVGAVVGPGNPAGTRIAADAAAEHVFGLVLVNDWSARDIQAWETRPLGPFLGKSFATTISPWVVPLAALEPFRVPQPAQDPAVLPYLRTRGDWAYDIRLEAALAPETGQQTTVTTTNFRTLYWTIAQMLAHQTVNGMVLRPGDLYASGTVSGAEPAARASMLEVTWRGQRPLRLPDGSTRGFLADGDRITLRGASGGGDRPTIGFGEASGTIVAAEDAD